MPTGDAANGAAISSIYAAELSCLRAELDALRASNNHLCQQAQARHSSTAACPTATSHASKFVRLSDLPNSAMLETQVTLLKAAYGEPVSSDYHKNMIMATTLLSKKFGVAKHKVITNIEEGDMNKSMHV